MITRKCCNAILPVSKVTVNAHAVQALELFLNTLLLDWNSTCVFYSSNLMFTLNEVCLDGQCGGPTTLEIAPPSITVKPASCKIEVVMRKIFLKKFTNQNMPQKGIKGNPAT